MYCDTIAEAVAVTDPSVITFPDDESELEQVVTDDAADREMAPESVHAPTATTPTHLDGNFM